MSAAIPTLDDLWKRLDDPSKALWEHDVDRELTVLHNEIKAAGQTPTDEYRAEATAFKFSEDHDNNSEPGWGTYYGPSMGFTDPSGNPFWVPDIKNLPPPMVAHWAARAAQVRHPV